MEMEPTAGDRPALNQAAVKTWLPSNTRGTTPDTSRFHGDGVRYKAKLIGLDPVPEAQGEKMCRDSMMKLKGFEEAARRQGRHKQRVWLKVCSGGLKIVDERTGAVLHDQDKNRMSSLTKDETDPRALAYIYRHGDHYVLFYIRMANQAEPVLADIRDMCRSVQDEAPQEPPETPPQNNSILPLNLTPSFEENTTPESPRPEASPGQPTQSSQNELLSVFSIPLEDPLTPTQTLTASPPPEPPQPERHTPLFSTAQILSMFPGQHPSVSQHWAQIGPHGNQWAAPAVAPWPNVPSNIPAWAAQGMAPEHMWAGPQPGMGGVSVNNAALGSFPNPNPPLDASSPAGRTETNSNQNFDPLL